MTLATIALDCAIQLGRANAAGTAIADLETQIKAEIGEAIRHYNRKPWNFTELRGAELTTVASQKWYSTVDLANAGGDQSVAGRTSVDVNQLLSVDYMREDASGLTDKMRAISYEHFERLQEGSSPGGFPEAYALYGGQIGIYPTPGGAYSIYISGHFKPVVPTADGDGSVWFDDAAELIKAAACKRVALKYLRDPERAAEYAAIEQEAERQAHSEHIRKTSTRRIKVHD